MPNQYLQQLTKITSTSGNFLVPISDDPSGSGILKGITLTNLFALASGGVTSVAGRTGAITIGESDVTNLVSDLGYKSPLSGSLNINVLGTITTGIWSGTNITEAQVTNLVSDLALKAPLASPTLTGVPLAPTAPSGTNTTQIATTAFVSNILASGFVNSVAGRTGTVTLAESDITNLVSDLGYKSPLSGSVNINTVGTITAGTWSATNLSESQVTNLTTDLNTKVTKFNVVNAYSNYNALASDFVLANTASGSLTITLPSAPTDKTRVGIKMVVQSGGLTNTYFYTSGSDVFNIPGGATSGTLKLSNQAIQLMYNSSTLSWITIADDLPLGGLDNRYAMSTYTVAGHPLSGSFAIATSDLSNIPAYTVIGNTTNSAAPPSPSGLLIVGTPGFSLTAGTVAGQFTSSIANNYQLGLQNTSSNSNAATNFVVIADNGSATTHNAKFGINSSTGGPTPFPSANAVSLYSTDNELDIAATGSSGNVNFYTNGGTTPVLAGKFDNFQNLNLTSGVLLNNNLGLNQYNSGTLSVVRMGTVRGYLGQDGMALTSSGIIRWGTTSEDAVTIQDTFIRRAGAGHIRLGNLASASPSGQTLSVQGVSSGTTNGFGANFTIAGSIGTGSGLGGSIIFQVAPATASGNATNPLVTAVTIDSTQLATFTNGISTASCTITNSGIASTSPLRISGALFAGGTGTTNFPHQLFQASGTAVTTWSTAGTYLGVNADPGFAGNFLDFHVNGAASATSINSAGDGTFRDLNGRNLACTGGVAAFIRWTSSTKMSAPADGQQLIQNNAGTGFTSLNLGPTVAAPTAVTLQIGSVLSGTTNTAGSNFTIAGSQSTGTGAGGSLLFKTSLAGSTGAVPNPLVTALTIDQTGLGTFAGSVTAKSGLLSAVVSTALTSSVVPIIGKGAASQSADLCQVIDSNSNILFAHDKVGRPYTGNTTPTIAAGTGAGTGPTVSISGTDVNGIISVTTGTLPTGSAIVVTVTFSTAFAAAPKTVILTAANSGASGLSGLTMVYIPPNGDSNGITTTTFVLMVGATGLAAATAYKWYFNVLG